MTTILLCLIIAVLVRTMDNMLDKHSRDWPEWQTWVWAMFEVAGVFALVAVIMTTL